MRYFDSPDQAADALREGHLIAHPTTGLPGFAADPLHDGALDRLDAIKARQPRAGYIAISSLAQHFSEWLAACPLTRRLLEHAWDGPVTIIGAAGRGAPARLRGPEDTIALRLERHSAVVALSTALERPLVSTSLNRHGQPPTTSLEEMDPSLEALLAGAFWTGAPSSGIASTIVRVQDGQLRCIRDGGVPMSRVREIADRLDM